MTNRTVGTSSFEAQRQPVWTALAIETHECLRGVTIPTAAPRSCRWRSRRSLGRRLVRGGPELACGTAAQGIVPIRSARLARPLNAACKPRTWCRAALLLLSLSAVPARADTECDQGQAIGEGLCLSMVGTFDAYQNLAGGIRPGPAVIGQLRTALAMDFDRIAGLEGWTGMVSVYGIYGRPPTPTRVGSLAAVSDIGALPTIRLYDLWLQRSLGAWGSFRFGQFAADGEFAAVYGAGYLVNATFGWPAALTGALPAGGPGYPLPTLGARLALGDPDGGTGLRAAIFSGNPAGQYGVDTNPQMHDRYGTIFSTSGGIFAIAEAVTGGPAPADGNGPRDWVLKLGGWFHNGGFDSVLFDDTGRSLADPASTGVPYRYANNQGGYAISEVTLWREGEGWLAVFGRAFAQPADRNAIAWQLDGGLAWGGPFGRANDVVSAGLSWTRIGSESRTYDRDVNAFGTPWPIRSHETMLELNYSYAAIANRLAIQPLVQFYFNPAAGEPNQQRGTNTSLPDAFVIGLRLVASL